jgi:GxxExxY protein
VHSALGPGLLESAYEACLEEELLASGLVVKKQVGLPLVYGRVTLETGYRLDMMVEGRIILEIKAIDEIAPVHKAQLMTYLKLTKIKLGLLLNFNVKDMKQGITRIIM